MKAFGLKRVETAARMKPGTSRPCPCCTYVRAGDVPFERAAKKRERFAGRTEISSGLLEMELDAAGVKVVQDLWPSWKKRTPYDPNVEYAVGGYYHPYKDPHYTPYTCDLCGRYECDGCYEWYRHWDEYDDSYYDTRDRVDERASYWAALWVDGRVDAPHDYDDGYYPDEYNWMTDDDYYDWYQPRGREDGWDWPDDPTPEVPGLEVLTHIRQAERLRAGERYFKQNKRTVDKGHLHQRLVAA